MSILSYSQTWTGNASSDWSNSSNWSGGVPNQNSSVTIPGNRPNSPVITGSVTIKNLNIGDWNNATTLTVDGGSLTVKENVQLYNYGELKMISGSILLDKTKNNNNFSFAYTGAKITLISGTFTSNLDISINGSMTTGTTDITMNGVLTVADDKTLTSSEGGDWNINSNLIVNGTLDIQGANLDIDGTFTVSSGGIAYAGTGNHHFRGVFDVGSNGTFHGESSTSIIYNDISAKNSAYITVGDGSIEFRGDVDLFQTSTLEVTGSGSVSITGTGQFKQNGRLLINNGNLNITGDVNFQQGGTLNVGSGSVDITGSATFSQSGTMNIANGSVTITGSADFDQSGTVNAESATITIQGNLTLGSNGSVFNAGGSTINLEGGSFTNRGTFNPDTSTVNFTGGSSQSIEGDITFYNLNVETSGDLTTNGSVVVLNDASVDDNSNLNVTEGETIDIQGELDDPSGAVSSNRPFVRAITSLSPNQVRVEFSEGITAATGNTASNYQVTHGLSITSAVVQSNSRFIILTLSGDMNNSIEYSFVFNNLVGIAHGQVISTDHIKRYKYIPASNTPAKGVFSLRVTAQTETTATLRWFVPDADGALIVVRQIAPVTTHPQDFTTYTANTVFGSGSAIGGNQYVVFASSDSTVTISGLAPNKKYHVAAYTFNGTFPSVSSYNTTDVKKTTLATPFQLDLTLFLGGAMKSSGTSMNTILLDRRELPLSQPFSELYSYNGGESVPSYPVDNIVDWVLVEIRRAGSPEQALDTTIVQRKALFLLSDGSIRDLDGTSLPTFNIPGGGKFVTVVYHRNHLPVMSGDTISRGENQAYSLDFSGSASAWYEENSVINLNGVYCASSGKTKNGNNYVVNMQTYIDTWNARNSAGYLDGDVDLDGEINAADRAQVFNSRNNSVRIPAQEN